MLLRKGRIMGLGFLQYRLIRHIDFHSLGRVTSSCILHAPNVASDTGKFMCRQ